MYPGTAHESVSVWLTRWPIVFLLLHVFLSTSAQTGESAFIRQAERYFESKQYHAAAKSYTSGHAEAHKDKTIRLHYAISLYETYQLAKAISILQTLIGEGKTDPYVYFHLARSHEAGHQFDQAIVQYKRFLQHESKDEVKREWVKDQLIRCANGQRLRFADERAYVENAEGVINTAAREFGVKNSPTQIGRIYFSSDRADSRYNKPANGNVDIYATNLQNGSWSIPEPLPTHINSKSYDELCGFSTDGQVLYFFGQTHQGFQIKTDTFSGGDGHIMQGIWNGPVNASHAQADIFFFHDTICMFSSNRPGGFGGYDLYISLWQQGKWQTPVNLGPSVNTFYDERFPFLTRNGLTLFYSSNGLESMGGFDIMMTTFDPDHAVWSLPVNLALPINSSADDTHFTLAPDGVTAYITSNRKQGFGAEDIHRVLFKNAIKDHQEISFVPTFQHYIESKNIDPASMSTPSLPMEIKEYFISHLYLEDPQNVLTPQNIKKLDLIVNMMMIYPRILVEFSCFELPEGPRSYSVYYSIKKAEEVREYMIRKGISADRILLKGYGSSFPLVGQDPNAPVHPLYRRINARIEARFSNAESEPVRIHTETIQVPDHMIRLSGTKYRDLSGGLYYSIQLASVTQILQHPILESLEELYIDYNPENQQYRYMAGILSSFADATAELLQIREFGFEEAKIIPYINGIRIGPGQLDQWRITYPDLDQYKSSSGR